MPRTRVIGANVRSIRIEDYWDRARLLHGPRSAQSTTLMRQDLKGTEWRTDLLPHMSGTADVPGLTVDPFGIVSE